MNKEHDYHLALVKAENNAGCYNRTEPALSRAEVYEDEEVPLRPELAELAAEFSYKGGLGAANEAIKLLAELKEDDRWQSTLFLRALTERY